MIRSNPHSYRDPAASDGQRAHSDEVAGAAVHAFATVPGAD
jgi:hypothetical protein